MYPPLLNVIVVFPPEALIDPREVTAGMKDPEVGTPGSWSPTPYVLPPTPGVGVAVGLGVAAGLGVAVVLGAAVGLGPLAAAQPGSGFVTV